MKTISKISLAVLLIIGIGFIGCRDTKKEENHDHSHNEQGHSHDENSDHSHEHEEVKQEEFTVSQDSIKPEEKTHTHDNGEKHHDH